MLHLDFAAVTHRGVVRSVNEDSVVAEPPVFLVADGIGGADAGDRASSIVAEEFRGLARAVEGSGSLRTEDVSQTLLRAHSQVYELSQSMPRGAATTAAGCVAQDVNGQGYWLVFNIGDSRVYRCSHRDSNRRIKQVSVDHSLVQDMVDAGQISRKEAFIHPKRNVVTRAIGAHSEPCRPDFWMLPMLIGERIMICSDGLLSDSPAEKVRQILKSVGAARDTVAELLRLALSAGARDNVSVIVIDVVGDETAGSLRGSPVTASSAPDLTR